MKKIAFFIVSACMALEIGATEQIKERFLIDDTDYPIRETPLSQLYDHDELSSILRHSLCTASWRGYRGTWVLRDGYLWLQHLRKNPCSETYEPIDARLLFEGKEYPIKAVWYTGKIVLPIGDRKYIYREGRDPEHYAAGDMLGYDLEAVVFNFSDGELVSKKVELIQERYDF